jgi:hypothetical protein
MLGDRDDPARSTVIWIVVAFVAILAALLAAHYVRRRVQRGLSLGRSMDQLERIGAERDLNYVEQVALEKIAKASKIRNPSQLVTSVDAFDQAVAGWMTKVMRMPWLQMEEQVALLTEIRGKLGFRYLPPERRPTSTRHLALGQMLYVLAGGAKRLRLLRAPVVDLDDMAIRTETFGDEKPVRLPPDHEFLAFFWSEDGGEYRFRTRIIKAVERPTAYLFLTHGDSLVADEGRKTVSCDLAVESAVDRLSATDLGRAVTSANLFARMEDKIESLPLHLNELSGSGFTFATQERAEVNDLVRIQGAKGVPEILEGKVARLVKVTSSRCFAKFVKLTDEEREAILAYIVPRISVKAFRKQTGARQPASR